MLFFWTARKTIENAVGNSRVATRGEKGQFMIDYSSDTLKTLLSRQ